jgi:hypothetical protein
MTTVVKWPMECKIDDLDICDWLQVIVDQNPKEIVFKYVHDDCCIHFIREEDAVAFKLKFGL